jgi:hypothetical protein
VRRIFSRTKETAKQSEKSMKIKLKWNQEIRNSGRTREKKKIVLAFSCPPAFLVQFSL